MATKTAARVECRDCHFSVLVTADEERNPADVVIEHGKETGHKLSVTSVEE